MTRNFYELRYEMAMIEKAYGKQGGSDLMARKRSECKTSEDFKKMSKKYEEAAAYFRRMSEILMDLADELEDSEEI